MSHTLHSPASARKPMRKSPRKKVAKEARQLAEVEKKKEKQKQTKVEEKAVTPTAIKATSFYSSKSLVQSPPGAEIGNTKRLSRTVPTVIR